MRGVEGRIALAIFGLLLAGCSINGIKHNDVLIFGTDTKLALDISTSPTSGGTPELTIGYKRQEAVWMPLIVNGNGADTVALRPLCLENGEAIPCEAGKVGQSPACEDDAGKLAICAVGLRLPKQLCLTSAGAPVACTLDLQSRKYVGTSDPISGKPGGTDAYSVFASFGANIKGAAKEGTAAVGLAQFFATGIAAQRLAANAQVANALSVQPEGTGQAMAAASAGQRTDADIRREYALLDWRTTTQTVAQKSYACSVWKTAAAYSAALTAKDAATDPAVLAAIKAEVAAYKVEDDFTTGVRTWGADYFTKVNATLCP